MPLQELNLIVTVKKSKEVLFQIAPVSKEKLLKINGLQIGKLIPESPQMKCQNCLDLVKVNLFWTKCMVVVGGPPPPKSRNPVRPRKEKAKPAIVKNPFDSKCVEISPTKQEIKVENIEDGFEEEHLQKSESESEYEIPKWCENRPKVAPKVKTTKQDPHGLCHICSRLIRRDALPEHLFKHEIANNRPYECNECGRFFSRVESLRDHLIQKHFNSLAKFLCPHCASVFNRNSHLRRHLYNKHHVGTSQHQTCPHCSQILKSKASLKSHIENMHTDPAQKTRYPCEECGKIFYKKFAFRLHLKTHLPEDQRPFRCWCGKSFITSYGLTRHHMEHEDPELVLYKCEFCNKGFKYRNSLTVHTRIHTGEQPYECKFCKKRFGDRSNHRNHMKQHENEMGVKLTLSSEERRLLHHKVLNEEELFGGESSRD